MNPFGSTIPTGTAALVAIAAVTVLLILGVSLVNVVYCW